MSTRIKHVFCATSGHSVCLVLAVVIAGLLLNSQGSNAQIAQPPVGSEAPAHGNGPPAGDESTAPGQFDDGATPGAEPRAQQRGRQPWWVPRLSPGCPLRDDKLELIV